MIGFAGAHSGGPSAKAAAKRIVELYPHDHTRDVICTKVHGVIAEWAHGLQPTGVEVDPVVSQYMGRGVDNPTHVLHLQIPGKNSTQIAVDDALGKVNLSGLSHGALRELGDAYELYVASVMQSNLPAALEELAENWACSLAHQFA